MNRISESNMKPILLLIAIILLIAGLADIKYKGVFFRLLPKTIQSHLADSL